MIRTITDILKLTIEVKEETFNVKIFKLILYCQQLKNKNEIFDNFFNILLNKIQQDDEGYISNNSLLWFQKLVDVVPSVQNELIYKLISSVSCENPAKVQNICSIIMVLFNANKSREYLRDIILDFYREQEQVARFRDFILSLVEMVQERDHFIWIIDILLNVRKGDLSKIIEEFTFKLLYNQNFL